MNRLVAVSAALLFVMPEVAHAQNVAVAGIVVAEGTQRPLAGAQVVVQGVTGKGAVTDASGRFSLTGLSGTTVILNVRLIGYRPVTDTVNVGASDVRISLSERALELN